MSNDKQVKNYELSPVLELKVLKLAKKNKELYFRLLNKILEIVNSESIDHYKNLRYDFKDSKRVHFGHFVLVFRYEKNNDLIIFEDFDHHDNIYLRN